MRRDAGGQPSAQATRLVSAGRLEAFSDGVLAILITIMVLGLRVPHGSALADLRPVATDFACYALSFVNIGIYWVNHHHLLKTVTRVTGGVMWANLNLLFWLSLIPFTTAYVAQNHFAALPVAVYGIDLFACGAAYYTLQWAIKRANGEDSVLAAALGSDLKGKASVGIYAVAIALTPLSRWLALGLYWVVAIMWLIPDRRLAATVEHRGTEAA